MQKINSLCQRKHINKEEHDRKAENVIFQLIAEFRDLPVDPEWEKNSDAKMIYFLPTF